MYKPCKSWSFLQWRNPWGPWSKCSYEKEHDHYSSPVNEYTPSGDKTQSLYRTWLLYNFRQCSRILSLTFIDQFKNTITLGSVGEPLQKPNFTLRASRLRLISAVSIKVVRSLLLTSVPRSFPAKSTNENLPCSVEVRLLRRKEIWRTACERDELLLAEVWPDVLGWRRKKKHGRGLHSLTGKTGKHNQKQINTFKKKKKNLFSVTTCMQCLSVSSWWPPLRWTRTPPPGPQPELAVSHPPGPAAWPSCSAGQTPNSRKNILYNSSINFKDMIFQSQHHPQKGREVRERFLLTFPL